MIVLSTKWGQELIKKPETGMGYQIASILLKNGKKFNQVVIIEGTITQVRGYKDIPFNEDQIQEIIVTHDKWNFREKEMEMEMGSVTNGTKLRGVWDDFRV